MASVTTWFWLFDSGNHGGIAPLARKPKKRSPSTSTLGDTDAASSDATVDFPAPGGPVTITSPRTALSLPAVIPRLRQNFCAPVRRNFVANDDWTRAQAQAQARGPAVAVGQRRTMSW